MNSENLVSKILTNKADEHERHLGELEDIEEDIEQVYLKCLGLAERILAEMDDCPLKSHPEEVARDILERLVDKNGQGE